MSFYIKIWLEGIYQRFFEIILAIFEEKIFKLFHTVKTRPALCRPCFYEPTYCKGNYKGHQRMFSVKIVRNRTNAFLGTNIQNLLSIAKAEFILKI